MHWLKQEINCAPLGYCADEGTLFNTVEEMKAVRDIVKSAWWLKRVLSNDASQLFLLNE
jgi:hypothetical protein